MLVFIGDKYAEVNPLKIRNRIIPVIAALLLTSSVFAAGCGENEAAAELEIYKSNLTTFFENISYLDSQLNALDPNSESSREELLGYLDQINEQFAALAALDVPEQFTNVKELAAGASENMNHAVEYYKEAYTEEAFNENYAVAANEYYSRANERLVYILQFLHGDTEITETDLSFETLIYVEAETEELPPEEISETVTP